MPGAQCTRSLACNMKKAHERSHREVRRDHPAFPHAMVLTVSFVLSPVTGLFCHRRRRRCLHRLDSSVGASGPHDFAVHLKRRSSCSAISVHRIPPRVRDDRASAPLWDGTVSDILLICVRRKRKYFCKGGWTGFSDLPAGHNQRMDHRHALRPKLEGSAAGSSLLPIGRTMSAVRTKADIISRRQDFGF